METIYLSLSAQVAVGTFFMKSPVLASYILLTPSNGLSICILKTYQAFKSREGIIFRKIPNEWLKI